MIPVHLLWLPYVILSLVLIALAFASFLHYHFNNRSRSEHYESSTKLNKVHVANSYEAAAAVRKKKYRVTMSRNGRVINLQPMPYPGYQTMTSSVSAAAAAAMATQLNGSVCEYKAPDCFQMVDMAAAAQVDLTESDVDDAKIDIAMIQQRRDDDEARSTLQFADDTVSTISSDEISTSDSIESIRGPQQQQQQQKQPQQQQHHGHTNHAFTSSASVHSLQQNTTTSVMALNDVSVHCQPAPSSYTNSSSCDTGTTPAADVTTTAVTAFNDNNDASAAHTAKNAIMPKQSHHGNRYTCSKEFYDTCF